MELIFAGLGTRIGNGIGIGILNGVQRVRAVSASSLFWGQSKDPSERRRRIAQTFLSTKDPTMNFVVHALWTRGAGM